MPTPPAMLEPFASTAGRPPWSRVERDGFAVRLRAPLNVAGYVTWAAIAARMLLALHARAPAGMLATAAVCLLGWLALFVARIALDGRSSARWRGTTIVILLQGVVAVATIVLPQGFIAVALLIMVAAQLFVILPVRTASLWMLGFNAVVALAMQAHVDSMGRLLLEMLPLLGFQTFAAMTAYYAASAEGSRDAAARINAELLATRALLEESARGEERLRLSRELHDVAGHKLTALKLNLRRLARDPACAGHEAVALASQLGDELLDDIRAVVGELRRHDGIGLRGALDALTRQTPGVAIRIDMDEGIRVDGVGTAEALLRTAQEAITNALRHGGAGTIHIRCTRSAGVIELDIADDGAATPTIRPGNGLRGMRERIEALDGRLEVTPREPRGVRVRAVVPARAPGAPA